MSCNELFSTRAPERREVRMKLSWSLAKKFKRKDEKATCARSCQNHRAFHSKGARERCEGRDVGVGEEGHVRQVLVVVAAQHRLHEQVGVARVVDEARHTAGGARVHNVLGQRLVAAHTIITVLYSSNLCPPQKRTHQSR